MNDVKRFIPWMVIIVLLSVVALWRSWGSDSPAARRIIPHAPISQIMIVRPNGSRIALKKTGKTWTVMPSSGPHAEPAREYPGDTHQLDRLSSDLQTLRALEQVSVSTAAYERYQLDDAQALKVTVTHENGKTSQVWFGKPGGFSYEETYVRIPGRRGVYNGKGVQSYQLNRDFPDFCDKTILKLSTSALTGITLTEGKKTRRFGTTLKDGTTTWVNLETRKPVDEQKFATFTSQLIGLSGATIFEYAPATPPVLEASLALTDGASIRLTVLDKSTATVGGTGGMYPVTVKKMAPSSAVEAIGTENVLYGIYEYQYNNLKDLQ